MKRVYLYILSALGLGGGFIGVALLIKFIIDRLTGSYLFMDDTVALEPRHRHLRDPRLAAACG